jgi:hypothetical protein
MRKIKALEDINRSARSLGAPCSPAPGFTGFIDRVVRQYGPHAVLWAVDRSNLDTLQAAWVKRWIQDKTGGTT